MKQYQNHIHIDPNIMLGKPVIKGTRIPVELIVRKIGEGALPEDLLDAYPNMIIDDADLFIAACALTTDATLVTNNTRHFKRIEELRLKNWSSSNVPYTHLAENCKKPVKA